MHPRGGRRDRDELSSRELKTRVFNGMTCRPAVLRSCSPSRRDLVHQVGHSVAECSGGCQTGGDLGRRRRARPPVFLSGRGGAPVGGRGGGAGGRGGYSPPRAGGAGGGRASGAAGA